MQETKPYTANQRGTIRAKLRKGIASLASEGIGHKIGSTLAGPLGGTIGMFADSLAGRIFGKGDYATALPDGTSMPAVELNANSFMKPMTSENIPAMHSNSNGAVRVTRREFLANVSIKDTGVVTAVDIEPQAFPWMKQLVPSWERYIMLGCVIEYIPTSGQAVAGVNTALGSVHACSVTDVGQVGSTFPGTKEQILKYSNSVNGAPYLPWVLPVECAPDQLQMPVKYLAIGPQTGIHIDQTKLARVIIRAGETQSAANFVCGELWVSYDVLLMSPRSFTAPALPPIVAGDVEASRYGQLVRDHARLTLKHNGIYVDDDERTAIAAMRDIELIELELGTVPMIRQHYRCIEINQQGTGEGYEEVPTLRAKVAAPSYFK